jgi:hypothetical protein
MSLLVAVLAALAAAMAGAVVTDLLSDVPRFALWWVRRAEGTLAPSDQALFGMRAEIETAAAEAAQGQRSRLSVLTMALGMVTAALRRRVQRRTTVPPRLRARYRLLSSPEEIVESHLTASEQTVLVDEPLPNAALAIVIGLILALAFVTGFLVVAKDGGMTAFLSGFVAIGVLTITVITRRIKMWYVRYVLTDFRLIRTWGIFQRHLAWMPWASISDVSIHQTLGGRLFGYATVRIESVDKNSCLTELQNLGDPHLFHRYIIDVMRKQSEVRFPDWMLSTTPVEDVILSPRRRRPLKLQENYTTRWRLLSTPEEIVASCLTSDERTILVDPPRPIAFHAIAIALTLVVTLLAALLAQHQGGEVGIFLRRVLVIDLLTIMLLVRRMKLSYVQYVLTDFRLIRTWGIFQRHLAWMPWPRISNVSIHQTVSGRLLGYATLRIESAEEHSGLRELPGLRDPHRFHRYVVQVIEEQNKTRIPDWMLFAARPSAPAASSVDGPQTELDVDSLTPKPELA